MTSIKYYIENNFSLETEKKEKNAKFFAYRTNIRQNIIKNLLLSPENIDNGLYPQDLTYLQPILPNTEIKYNDMYCFGFSLPQKESYWSTSRKCIQSFKVLECRPFQLLYDCDAYIDRKKHKKLFVSVWINNQKKADWVFTYRNNSKILKINVNPDDLDENNICHLLFLIKNPVSPKELKKSEDHRKLGIMIKKIKIS